jgi:hypothetical protein
LGLVVALAGGDQQDERPATPVSAHMQLGAKATATAPKRLFLLPAPRSSGVLMRTNDGTVDEVDRPIEPAFAIGLALQGDEETLPDASASPAREPTGDRLPGSIVWWQVTPGSSCRQDPKHAIDDPAMRM